VRCLGGWALSLWIVLSAWRNKFMKSFLIAAGSMGLLGVINGALSLFGLGDPVLIQPDDQCGYVLRPNQAHYRFFVHTRINSHSMRSSEFPARKGDHVYRIMFVGDSITYGTTRVDQNDIFTELVHHEMPSQRHEQIEVLNASANAWGIANELGYIRSRGIFNSDVVVLVLNDGDLSQRKSTVTDVGTQMFLARPACALCEVARHYAESQRADRGTTDNSNRSQREANLKDLKTFHDFVHANHSKMLILFVPFRKNLPVSTTSVIQPELVGWAQSESVPVIDTTASLASLPISKASIDDGTHLSAAGNIAVASAFVSFMKAEFSAVAPLPQLQ
jgi:hypothetical protein